MTLYNNFYWSAWYLLVFVRALQSNSRNCERLKYVLNVYCVTGITNHGQDLQPQKTKKHVEFPLVMERICSISKGLKIDPLFQIIQLIVSITKFSIVIGSPRAYLWRNGRAMTWVSNYSLLIWTFCNRTPVIGYPCDFHANNVHFNGFLSNVFYSF